MRPPVWDKPLLFGGGLLINLLAALFVVRPDYMDAYYYFGGALQLAQGRGFTEPYLWNYLIPFTALPVPSHLYWQPLTSLVAAPFVALAQALIGSAATDGLFKAAQIPFCIAGAALPLLAYTLAWQTTQQRRHAWLAATLTFFSSYYFLYWATSDSFALFALAGAGTLLAAAHAENTGQQRWWWVAGICAGCAHLARTDGPLLLVIVALWGFWRKPNLWPRWGALSLGYLLIMGPWFGRNWLTIGAPLAPGSTYTLWLRTYNDLFSYPASNLTPARYFAAGLGPLLSSRWDAFLTNFGNLLGAQNLIFALPFTLLGFWQLRRHWVFQAASAYAISLFLVMTLVFPLPGARGGYLHSGAVLLPFFYTAFASGLDAVLAWVVRYRPHWHLADAQRVFSVFFVLLAVGLSVGLFTLRYRPLAPRPAEVYAQIGQWLAQAETTPRPVVVNNPPGFYYHTRYPALVIPNGETNTLNQVIDAFDAHWVVLDANYPADLAALYADPTHSTILQLRATFKDAAQKPVYLFEVQP